jgi:hypothetical protein
MDTPTPTAGEIDTASGRPARLPIRQLTWTRLGTAMGYTDTSAKRDEIRAAVEAISWVEPIELSDVRDTPPARQVIAGLFYQRPWALHLAASLRLPDDSAGRTQRLIGLQSATGHRYVLLSLDYEVVALLHEAPIHGEAAVTVTSTDRSSTLGPGPVQR